ncbi:hypothetical protein [Flavobacterium chilense]|uniref:Knr4/Smi1-like domain-containing protein n=1 Tax=Flavobacterium chilense TaxID=946677 RepID=A0A1M7D2Q0_9FLAO|nr:hypothetical protein [Flavobacterium chilense]SHL73469.1 hypothetical protein SAMN05444484_102392 [Flavobacterium chilense]
MDSKIIQKISLARIELEKNPANITFGQLKKGIENSDEELEKRIGVYSDFLKITNGARCGSIDLWSHNDLQRNQFILFDRQNSKKSLISIGQILYEPLILDINNQNVYTFKRGDESSTPMTFIRDFEYFLNNYVFGEKYGEIIPDYENDEWFLFLKNKHSKIKRLL